MTKVYIRDPSGKLRKRRRGESLEGKKLVGFSSGWIEDLEDPPPTNPARADLESASPAKRTKETPMARPERTEEDQIAWTAVEAALEEQRTLAFAERARELQAQVNESYMAAIDTKRANPRSAAFELLAHHWGLAASRIDAVVDDAERAARDATRRAQGAMAALEMQRRGQ